MQALLSPKALRLQVFWLIGRILSKINCKTQILKMSPSYEYATGAERMGYPLLSTPVDSELFEVEPAFLRVV